MKSPSDRALLHVQAWSGLAFASFAVLHLANTMLASFGQDVFDRYQQLASTYYQAPGVELAVVLLAAFVHAVAGVLRVVRRRAARTGEARKSTLRVRLHRASGVVLLGVVFAHALATRGPGLWFDTPADFSFVSFSLHSFPWFFYPYYLVFALSGLYHLSHGALLALNVVGLRVPSWATSARSKPFWIAVAVGSIALVAGILAMGGAWFSVDTTRFVEFSAMYERFLPAGWVPAP